MEKKIPQILRDFIKKTLKEESDKSSEKLTKIIQVGTKWESKKALAKIMKKNGKTTNYTMEEKMEIEEIDFSESKKTAIGKVQIRYRFSDNLKKNDKFKIEKALFTIDFVRKVMDIYENSNNEEQSQFTKKEHGKISSENKKNEKTVCYIQDNGDMISSYGVNTETSLFTNIHEYKLKK